MKDPIEKIADHMAWTARYFSKNMPLMYSKMGCESPIESALITAFHMRLKFEFSGVSYVLNQHDKCEENEVHVLLQEKIGKYRVDFLIKTLGGRGEALLVVECDGHEFHERTKEQAARDRSRDRELSLAGYTVMRFTGSEIYRDPIKCSDQIIQWMVDRMNEPREVI